MDGFESVVDLKMAKQTKGWHKNASHLMKLKRKGDETERKQNSSQPRPTRTGSSYVCMYIAESEQKLLEM